MIKALHSWSLFRTLGRRVAAGSMPSGAIPEGGDGGLSLLELPAALAARGFSSVQLCHFYLPSRDPSYLAELRSAMADSDVAIECLLIDDGDLTDPDAGDEQEAWISGWLDVAEQLGTPAARVIAGKRPPTPELLADSARRLRRLAAGHPGLRLLTENWHALLPDAASVLTLLDLGEDQIGFLVDLGNWSGPTKYSELAAVASRAETCQAKCRAGSDGELDLADYQTSLETLRDGGYRGVLALVYDGPDPDEWANLEREYAVVEEVFAAS